MSRIDTPTKAENLFGPGKHGFRASAPGLLPTQLSADWCNWIQEVLLNPIEQSGLADGADTTLLTQAIQLISNIGVVTEVNANTDLTRAQRGLVLVNASAGNVTLTLPAADRLMDFMIKRVDNSANKVTINVEAPGDEAIFHNTEINADGYGFFRLYGKGDFWIIKCDANGGWHPVARAAMAPIGSLMATTGTPIPSGGWGKPNGIIYTRADFPWLWDYAGVSGNLRTELQWADGKQGGYSSGDGATTLRVMELRGEYIRVLDDGRGVNAAQEIGQWVQDAIRNITGAFNVNSPNTYTPTASGAFYTSGSEFGLSGTGYSDAKARTINFDASRQVPTANENRVRGYAFPHLIKLI